MIFHKCTYEERYRALDIANKQYDGNLCLTAPTPKSGSIRLVPVRSGVLGSRTSWKGKKLKAASWEAHRDFLKALFDINPNASVRTKFAHYAGKDSFYELFPDTAYINIGSQMEPCTMPDLTYEPEPEKRLKKGATAPFNAVVRKVRKALATRIAIGEWDDTDDSGPMVDQMECWVALVDTAEKLDRIAEHNARGDLFGGQWLTTQALSVLFQRRARPRIGSGGRIGWDYEFSRPKSSSERFEATVNAARKYWLKANEDECYEVIE